MNAPDRAGLAPPQTGRAVPRLEDDRFLTGTARFTDDVRFEGMLHAAILRSPHARARLSRVDLARVRAMPGVALAVSGRELSGRLSSIPMRLAALPGLERFLQKPIAVDEVRYVGEPVALVVAQSRYLAEDALELIEVDYEPQPPVTTMAEALADRHLVHADAGTNVAARYEVSRGNPQAAFARAPYTRKVQLRCHRHTGAPLETRGLVAESLSGRLWIWGATKVPFFNRRVLAAMLGLDEKSIDMIETDIGGGFGIRGEFYPEDFLIPWASVQIGRPVKWIEDRREHLLAANHARESECELEIAMSLQGEILGLRGRAMADLGAYVRTGGGVAIARTGQYLPGPYRIADYACEVIALVTDKTPVGTYRGPGRYEANFFRERLLDIACADLGLDPVAVREANLIRPEEMPYPIGRLVPIEAESAYERGDYRSGFRQALAALDYPTRPRDGALIDGLRHGVGVACFTESSGGGRSESARIRARSDGRFEIYSGVATMGQGHETVFAQIAADELHCPVDAFTVFHGSTTGVEEGWGTFHSRAVVVGGSAVKRAAEKLRESLLRYAAAQCARPVDSLELRDAAVILREDQSTILDVGRLAQAAEDGDAAAAEATQVSLRYDGSGPTYSYGTHVAHVAVDPETAQVRVLGYVALEDVGRLINPMLAEGQAVGGAVQGIGASFLDELVYDENGQLITASYADYLMATSTEAPAVQAVLLEEAPAEGNPLGAKGAGEGGIVATAAALANAVSNALGPLGVSITALPMSQDKLAAAIRTARAGGSGPRGG